MASLGHNSQSLPQFLSIGGRVVAELLPNGILDRRKFYLLRMPESSIGYDLPLLRDAERQGATIARNRDKGRELAYVAPINRIWELGFERDFGWGTRFFFPCVSGTLFMQTGALW